MTTVASRDVRRRRAWLTGCVTLAACGNVPSQEPQVRANVAAHGTIWVGQKVTLVIEVLAPGFFASVVIFDLADEEGLLLMPPVDHPIVSSEMVGSTSYTVQRHELAAFSTRSGEQTIPPLSARFGFKRSPLDAEVVHATVQTRPVRFTAVLPQGVTNAAELISADDLTAKETWQPDPATARPKAGDAFVRAITFRAPEVPAILFPPFPPGKVSGLGVYPGTPDVVDHVERGERIGERHDRITYVCERAGSFTIPAVRLTWWDTDAERLRRIDFPARTLTVAPDPNVAETPSGPAPADRRRTEAIWAVVAVAAAALLVAAVRWREKWRRSVAGFWAPFRPVHLQPLNPSDPNEPRAHP